MVIETSTLSRSGLAISQLGLVCASLAGIFRSVKEEDARATIDEAFKAGITYFDTAPFYGHGLSERLVGDGLRNKEGFVLSTKVGRLLKPGLDRASQAWGDALPFTPVFDYSYDGIMRSFEASLHRLGLDRIDILHVHDIGNLTHGDEQGLVHFDKLITEGFRALEELRMSGAISAFGLGVNEVAICEAALERGDWDMFLLAGRYTLLEQSPLNTLLRTCENRGTDIVIGAPFNSGVLVGGTSFDYGAIPKHIAQRVEAITRVCAAHYTPLPAVALLFPLAHPVVKSIIPGPRTPSELAQILKWWAHHIPQELWCDLKTEGLLEADAPTPTNALAP